MILLFVAALLTGGTALGWFAHRAYMRVDAWGHAMNEQDAIFRLASQEEFDGALRRIRVIRFEESGSDPMHTQPAGAK